jgi:hypothetical protein
MSISRILSECPNVQMSLSELFIEVGQREQLPFLEFLLSPENSKLIRTEVSSGNGKLKDLLSVSEEYEVEEILDSKQLRNKQYFLVKWKGYPLHDATWEPLENLTNARDLLERFTAKKLTNSRLVRFARDTTSSLMGENVVVTHNDCVDRIVNHDEFEDIFRSANINKH